MVVQLKPLAEINQQAMHLLYQELGVVDAVRFLKQFTLGFGDYTKERDLLFKDKTLDEILKEISEQQKPE